jgi:Kef-type K+ transport system membrane component KefB
MDFVLIAQIIFVASVFGVVARFLKQPLLVGYLVAGIFLSWLGIVNPDSAYLDTLAKLGVALLLFLLGIEMKLSELPTIGRVAVITGLSQILFTTAFGFTLAYTLGFSMQSAFYVGLALSFSSTIIIVKLLSEKKDLNSLYGRISIGFLLIQDFVAIAVLMYLSGLGVAENVGVLSYASLLVKTILLFSVVFLLSKKAIPRFFEAVTAGSHELIFILSIAWALVFSSVTQKIGFSFEIGGFLAGLAFSNLPEHFQISSKTKPLRDFFLTVFFVTLGAKLVVSAITYTFIIKALLLSLFVIVGNPIIVMTVLGILGYKKRTSFLSGLTVAQISEFSFILMSMGLVVGHVTTLDVSLVIMIGVLTMTASTYLITYADELYERIKKYLSLFEKKITKEEVFNKGTEYREHLVLVGCHRTGRVVLSHLLKRNNDYLVVDFNPDVYSRLTSRGINVVFGDINDEDVFEAAGIENSKLIISTVSNLKDNLSFLEKIRYLKNPPTTIFTASSKREAIALYENNADMVIVPEMIAGEHIKHLLDVYGMSQKKIVRLGKSQFNRLIYYV